MLNRCNICTANCTCSRPCPLQSCQHHTDVDEEPEPPVHVVSQSQRYELKLRLMDSGTVLQLACDQYEGKPVYIGIDIVCGLPISMINTVVDNCEYHVVNLSSHTLTNCELSVLNEGLNFVPTPPPPKLWSLQRDINNLARTLRLRLQFRNKMRLPTPFRKKSSYNPPLSTNPRVENYIHALKVGMTKLQPQKTVPTTTSSLKKPLT